MRRSRSELPIYHDSSVPVSLGCEPCPELGICGGLQTRKGLFNCQSFCECADPLTCQLVCPLKLEDFVNRVQEIRGFSLDNIPRANPLKFESLPGVIPHIYGRSHRNKKLMVPAVSVPLEKLFYRRTGLPKYCSKIEVAEAFGFDPNAALIINGVSEDRPIEDYWTHRRATRLADSFVSLEPALITVPNFSVFTNVPRWDNLYSVKRIAICWYEFMQAGVRASLHLNARTDMDWKRWVDFIGAHPEVRSVTFEFATGAALKERADFHVEKLIALARTVDQDLQLLVRGGLRYLKELDAAFAECVFLDTSSYVKTIKRRKLKWIPGMKRHWRSAKTPKGAPLDHLFRQNIQSIDAMVEFTRRRTPGIVSQMPLVFAQQEIKSDDPRQILLPWPQPTVRYYEHGHSSKGTTRSAYVGSNRKVSRQRLEPVADTLDSYEA